MPDASRSDDLACVHMQPFVPASRLVDVRVMKAVQDGDGAEVQRTFEHGRSVFRDWKVDTTRGLDETACLDIRQWKVRRFVKDEADYNRVEETIKANFQRIKHLFTVLIATPEFPNIGQLSMGNWCEEAGLLDKQLLVADIDRCFIAANLEDLTTGQGNPISADDGNPGTSLCRYEFLEILVRIAD